MLSLLMAGKQGPTNTKQTGPVTKSVCKLKLQLSSWLTRRGLQSELLHSISLDMNHLSMQYFLAQNIFFSQQHLGVLSQGLPPFDKAWFVLKKTKFTHNRESFLAFEWFIFGNLLFLIPKSLSCQIQFQN